MPLHETYAMNYCLNHCTIHRWEYFGRNIKNTKVVARGVAESADATLPHIV